MMLILLILAVHFDEALRQEHSLIKALMPKQTISERGKEEGFAPSSHKCRWGRNGTNTASIRRRLVSLIKKHKCCSPCEVQANTGFLAKIKQ